MLHRSFKPAKCKTSLKLATSRIKLMKNKKAVQINQINRELAHLLESGQDRTARIRVEHVIREEKMVAAYDLIEIYCELIAARLPIVESQKNCPIDLKKAITSVIFASPRCADIPELLDIRKQLTAKYGKEFISAAIELRPDCGVSHMLIEKLSAVAPDLQTKIKVLSAVAKEHDIKWDPNSFEENESKPPDDLLNGPNTFEKASNMHADPPQFQAPNVQPVHNHEEKHDGSFDQSAQDRRSSVGTQNFDSTGTGDIGTSSATHTDTRSSAGRVPDRMEVRQSFPRDGNDFSSGGQNWNMEFKDATSAAQAAAESAERASMAARAAAELSRQRSTESQRSNIRDEGPRDSRQYSTAAQRSNIRDEGPRDFRKHSTASQRSNIRDEGPRDSRQHSTASQRSNIKDEGPRDATQYSNASQRSNIRDEGRRDATSEYPGERRFRDSYNSSFIDRKPNVQNQQPDGSDHDTLQKAAESFYEYCKSASLRSNIGSVDDEKVVNSFQRADTIKEEEGPFSPEMSMKKDFRGSKIESVKSGQKDGFKSENYNSFGEGVIRKQASISSSHSHSSTLSDEYDVSTSDQQKFGKSTVPEPFISVDQGNIFRETERTSSVTFDDDDEADSDDDVPRFDMGPEYDEGEAKSYFPSPGRESPTRPLENTNTWSPRSNRSNAVEKSSSQTFLSPERHSFSEHSAKSVDSLERDNRSPVAFDHSDGPDSESEVELEKSTLSGTKQFTSFPHKHDLYSTDPELMQFESHDLRASSLPEKGKLESDIAAQSLSSSDYTKFESSNKLNSGKSRIELTDLIESASSFYIPVDEEKSKQSQQSSRLSLRNEFNENVRAPQSPDTLDDNDFLNQPNNLESGTELNFGTLTGGRRNKVAYRHPPYTRVSIGNTSSSSSKKTVNESSTTAKSSFNSRVNRKENKKPSVSNSSSDDSSEEFTQKASKQVNTRSKFEPPVAFLNDDGCDSEEDVPKQASTPPSSRVHLGPGLSRRTNASASSSKGQIESEAKIVNTTSNVDKKASKHSYSAETETETQPRPQPHTGRFNNEASKPIPKPKVSSMRNETRKTQAESSSLKQEAQDHSGSLKNEASNSKPIRESKISMREESLKSQSVAQPANKPSHVHPKLPDYDSIAARLEALRKNHQ